MNEERKCFIVTLGVLLAGFFIAVLIIVLLNKTGYTKALDFCFPIPFLFLGIYYIFGKYVYFRGEELDNSKKTIIGICFIVFPLIFAIMLALVSK